MRIESAAPPPHPFVFALTFFLLLPCALSPTKPSRLRKKGAVSASGQVLGAVALTEEEEDVIFQEGGVERFIQLARIGITRSYSIYVEPSLGKSLTAAGASSLAVRPPSAPAGPLASSPRNVLNITPPHVFRMCVCFSPGARVQSTFLPPPRPAAAHTRLPHEILLFPTFFIFRLKSKGAVSATGQHLSTVVLSEAEKAAVGAELLGKLAAVGIVRA